MAEGGYDLPDEDFDPRKNDDDRDNDDDDDEVNRTGFSPFKPQSSSTPYSQDIGLKTMGKQNEDPDSSYLETRFTDFPDEKSKLINETREMIKREYPNVDFNKLGPISLNEEGEPVIITTRTTKENTSKEERIF